MVRDLSSAGTAASGLRLQLNAHFAGALDCDDALLVRPSPSIVATPRRHAPEWHGWVLPVYAVAPVGTTACVLSCAPELELPLRAALDHLPPGVQPFDDAWLAAVHALTDQAGDAEFAVRTIYAADVSTFALHGVDPSVRVERLDRELHSDLWLTRAFDGPCFVVRDNSGGIASWAGTKIKSDIAWEIATVTEPAFRGRGLATLLTAAAATAAFEMGKLAVWIADRDNLASRRLVERLGFIEYGEQVSVSRFDPQQAPAPPPGSP